MKRIMKWLIVIVIAVLAVVTAVVAVDQGKRRGVQTESSEGETSTVQLTTAEETTETVTETETEPETEAYVSPIDFEALWEQNPDVIGWIRIEDTNIDYPIMFSGDNDYYLHHDIDGNETVAGSIYLDFENNTDMTSPHNIIYGHRMRDGSMFKDVIKFREEDFFKEHPYFTIYTPDREIRLKVVSCYYSANSYQLRRIYFPTQRALDQYVQRALDACPYSEAVEFPVRSLFTLITCSYEVDDARTMLQAVEVGEEGRQITADAP